MKSCKVDDLFDETQHPLGHPKFVDLFITNSRIYRLNIVLIILTTVPFYAFLPYPSSSLSSSLSSLFFLLPS